MTATPKKQKPEKTEEAKPVDFIYSGRRLLSGGKKLGIVIYLLDAEGELGDRLVYEAPRKQRFVMGGVYTGARFTATQVSGLHTATWTGKRFRATTVMQWEAEETSALATYRANRMEANAKSVSFIDEETKRLRELWSQMRARGDYDAANGLETAVLRSIRKGAKA